ncbi:MAG: 4-alpha-glucanotransferase [Synergistaceae bacterium]|jgi:4-alpha-glucanotransferase|nr:4-alpha-glucanotransferase [Synergistaceae bacterium]
MSERRNRKTGVLMHISSLPGRYGTGDLGESAASFARILAEAGVSAWQMLPLVPTNGAFSHSPYSSESAFAGNIMYICPEKLVRLGLIGASELERFTASGKTDFDRALRSKREVLKICHKNFRHDEAYKTKFRELSDKFWDFCAAEAYWLEDYALFSTLKELEGTAWNEWRPEYRTRDWSALGALKQDGEISQALDERRFEQFLFFSQLEELRGLCRALDITLIGDLPIYVAYDSADVWGRQDLFELDAEGNPASVAGVPPDYFSRTGQRWGNPIYKWDRMRNDGYQWWMRRFGHALKQADIVRIDHFRGFFQYWDIPASEPTAENGCWKPGPGDDMLNAMRRRYSDGEGRLPFIAEDLGILTDDVIKAMEDFGLPGMKVLQFAFGEGMPDNPYIPHNHRRNCVVYTGTHDNNTVVGWWTKDAADAERENFKKYMNLSKPDPEAAADAMIRSALSSTADLAVITTQDILRLGAEARMNTPSTTTGNWTWRLDDLSTLKDEMKRIASLNELFGRSHPKKKDEIEPECDSIN